MIAVHSELQSAAACLLQLLPKNVRARGGAHSALSLVISQRAAAQQPVLCPSRVSVTLKSALACS